MDNILETVKKGDRVELSTIFEVVDINSRTEVVRLRNVYNNQVTSQSADWILSLLENGFQIKVVPKGE